MTPFVNINPKWTERIKVIIKLYRSKQNKRNLGNIGFINTKMFLIKHQNYDKREEKVWVELDFSLWKMTVTRIKRQDQEKKSVENTSDKEPVSKISKNILILQ